MKNVFKRFLSLTLVVFMVVTMIPTSMAESPVVIVTDAPVVETTPVEEASEEVLEAASDVPVEETADAPVEETSDEAAEETGDALVEEVSDEVGEELEMELEVEGETTTPVETETAETTTPAEEQVEAAVAMLGETGYATLAEAVAAANELGDWQTITLLSDVAISETIEVNAMIDILGEGVISRAEGFEGKLFEIAANMSIMVDDDPAEWVSEGTEVLDMEDGTWLVMGPSDMAVFTETEETAGTASGTISSCLVDLTDSAETFIVSEITGLNATESVVVKLYSGETQIATTTLMKPEYFTTSPLGVKIIITGESGSWKTVWAEGMPRADVVPDTVVLVVDGQEMNSANVPMTSTNGELAVTWADVPGVNPAPANYVAMIGESGYESLDAAVTAASAGDTIVLQADVDSMPSINKAITIKGAEAGIEVNCAIAENFPDVDGTVTFENLTFNDRISTENASTDQSKMTLKFVGCTFNVPAGNTYAIQAGASWNNDVLGALVVEDCNFNASATSFTQGYMIYAQCVENVTVTDSTLDGNGVFRGAIHLGDSTVYATEATISGNTIKNFARGVQVGNRVEGSTLTIDGNTFENVEAINGENESAAVYIHEVANAQTTNVVFTNNEVGDALVIFSENATGAVTDFVTAFTGNTENGTAIELEGNYSDTVYAPAGPVEVATYEQLVAALAEGGEIKLTADITIDTAITALDGTTIDLNGNTLYINVENSYYNNVTIKNGNIVLGKDDVHVMDGYFLVNAGKTLVLNDVNVSSADGGIKGYAVFHLYTGANLDLIDSTLDISDNEYAAGYIVYAGESTATLDVTGTTITGSNVNGVVHATTVIKNSTVTLTDVTEHGINRSETTITNSTVTISGGTGRGITAEHGDLVIGGTSVVTISDMGEATIELRGDKSLTIADTATVTVDEAVNNTTSGTITGTVTVETTPAGDIANGYVTANFNESGKSGIFGEATGVVGTESFVVKLYSGTTLVGTAALVDTEKVLLNGQSNTVSWHILTNTAEDTDSWWATKWEPALNVKQFPDKVELWVDGVKVDTGVIELYGPDQKEPIVAAVTDDAGNVQSFIAGTGFLNGTGTNDPAYDAALKTAFTSVEAGQTVAMLRAGTYAPFFTGKDVTITGAVDGVEFDNIGAYNMGGANVTFNNVTFDYYPNVNYTGLQHAGNLEYNNCTFNGQVFLYGASETFNSCTFNQNSSDAYNVWTYGAKEVAFNNCTFNSAGKSVLIYSDQSSQTNDVTVTNCAFKATSAVEGKAAIEMDSSRQGDIKLTIDGATTATGFGKGNISGNSLWNNKNGNADEANNDITVTVNGEVVLKPVVLHLSGAGTETDPYLITNLEELKWFRDTVNTYTSDGSNQFKGKYVKLNADIDLAGINWTPIGTNSVGDHMAFLGTFDGDGHTISNLYINADGDHLGFFARVGSYAEDVTPTVKNLKFNNVDVSSNTTTGHGGSYVGGVIANAGGNSVVSNVTVTGDVYVVGYGYVGGIVGHGYPDIDNCHVEANDDSYINCYYWCVGGIIGYAGEGGTPISNCSVSGVDIWSAYGAAGAVAGLLQDGNTVTDVSASNVEITSASDYCMGYIAGNGEASTMTGITVDNVSATANGKEITSTDAVASVDGAIYFDLQSAIDAAEAGDTVTLLRDVELTAPITVKKSITIDGNGKTITQAAECDNNIALLYFEGESDAVLNVAVENVTFEGLKVGAAIRTLYANTVIDNVVFQNCEHTVGQGLVRLTYSTAEITNSKFLNNNCSMAISFNWDADVAQTNNDTLTVDNCEFTGNTANKTALVYYVKGIGCTITHSEFEDNVVNCSGNGAVIYLGFQDNCKVSGNLFKNNAVAEATESTRVAGAVFAGYQATITGNAFDGNTASNANDDELGQVCISTYYEEGLIDLSGNYWNGGAPVYGKDYTIQHQTGDGDYSLSSYNTTYTLDADGNVVLTDEVTNTFAAKIGTKKFATLAEAIEAAEAGDTVTILAGEYTGDVSVNKAITVVGETDEAGNNLVTINGKLSITADGATVKNLIVKNPSGDAAKISAKDVLIEGCDISGSNAFRYCYTSGTVTFKDSKLTADTWVIHFDGSAGGNVVVDNCEVNGWIALAGTLDKVTLKESTFNAGDWAGGRVWNKNVNIEGCTFSEGYKLDIANTGATVVVTDTTVTNSETKSLFHTEDVANHTITVDGVQLTVEATVTTTNAEGETETIYYATLAEAIAAVGAGDVVIELLSDATLDYNAREAYGTTETTSLTINGNGHTLTLNQKDSDWSSLGLANADAKLILNNMTIEKTGYGDTSGAWNTHAIIVTSALEMNDVTVNNSLAVEGGATLNNVTINEANAYYGLWINGNGQTVTVNGGAINATNGGRGIKIADEYVESAASVILNVTDTTFNTAKKAAVLVSSTAGANVTANGVNINNVAEDTTNFVWVDEDWAAYYNNVKTYDEAIKTQENEESFPIKVWYVNGEGVATSVRAYYKTLDELFAAPATQVPGSNYIDLRANVVAENQVNVSYGSNRVYTFGTSVEGGVTMEFKYADNWNMLPKFDLGENITMNVPYLQVIGGDISIAGTLNTDYLYLYGTGEGVTITETGVVTANTGDATVQVKGGTVLTVNGELNTSTLNVWTQDVNNSELIISGEKAKVNASHLHAWNGDDGVSAQKVVVKDGATLTATEMQADRGSEVTVDAATLTADSLTLGYEGNVGTLTVTNNGVITNGVVLNSVDSTVNGPEGMSVTTGIADHKVVYEDGVYKVVAKVYVAQVGEIKYETLAEAFAEAKDSDTITLLADVEITETLDVSFNSDFDKISVTFDGAGHTIKASESWSGNTWLADIAWHVTLKDITFDGNNLGMRGIQFYTSESTLENVIVRNISNDSWGVTDYAIHSNASSLKLAGKLIFENCEHGHLVLAVGSSLPEDAISKVDAGSANLEGVTIVAAAKIGNVYYDSIQAAVDAAEAGDTVTVIADVADEAVTVAKSLTITGDKTLKNVSITGSGADVDLTVSGLTFAGDSWINTNGAASLTVSDVTANVTPSNTSATNSRSAFIALGRSEQAELKLTVKDSTFVVSGGGDPILGWAAITEANITGNTFGAADAYIENADAVKFMAIADGAVFNITGNTVYSNYNGFVFGQNTTRDNAYTVNVDDNTFNGTADHIWVEVSGATTTHATIKATSDNTVNGEAFTATDIKAASAITTWTGYAGVDVETDADGKLTGGTYAVEPNAELIAEGYEAKFVEEKGWYELVVASDLKVTLSAIEAAYDAEVQLWLKVIIPEDLLVDENAYLTMTKAGRWGDVETKITMAELKEMGTDTQGRYVLSQGIASGEMTCGVTYKFFDGEDNALDIVTASGKELGTEATYSVMDYVKTILSGGTQEQKDIVTALVTYGGYAQKHFNVDAANPAYSILSEYGISVPSLDGVSADSITQKTVVEGNSIGVTAKNLQAFLDSAIYLRVYYTLDNDASIEDYDFELTYLTVGGAAETMKLDPVYEASTSRYYVDIPDIPAAYLDHMYSVKTTNTQTYETYTVSTSVLVWIKNMLNSTTDEDQVNMLKAMYLYNQAANKFFNK